MRIGPNTGRLVIKKKKTLDDLGLRFQFLCTERESTADIITNKKIIKVQEVRTQGPSKTDFSARRIAVHAVYEWFSKDSIRDEGRQRRIQHYNQGFV